MSAAYDHILFIGFGGPEKKEDVRPFLSRVALGRNIPAQRLREVEHHYELVGGGSRYNEYSRRIVGGVQEKLRGEGITLPFYLGMRNWHPLLEEIAGDIKEKGLRCGIGVIMAPHRSSASCFRYKQTVEEALARNNAETIQYDYFPEWYAHESYIKAYSDLTKRSLAECPFSLNDMEVIFCAHSIPVSTSRACGGCSYVDEYRATCELVARGSGISKWTMAFQSRSGRPQDPWLTPDICDVIKGSAAKGYKAVCVIPVGFFCDNVEVLYDLDFEAKKAAHDAALSWIRVPTPADHPQMIEMFASALKVMLGDESPSFTSRPI